MITDIMVWLVIIFILLGIEMATMGLTTVWFAGGALVAIIAALFQAPVAVQIALFLLVSLVLLFFTRPVAVKYFNKDRVKTNVDSVVGKQVVVTEEIDNLHGTGRAIVGGQEWSARNVAEDEKIPTGAVAVVEEIRGVKLLVRVQEGDK